MVYLKEKVVLKDVEQEIKNSPVEIGEINGKKVVFDSNVSCQKMLSFCQQMSNVIFNPNGMYLPKLKDVMVFAFLVENMTNIPIKKDKDSNYNIDYIYNLMNSEIGKKLMQKFKANANYYFITQELKTVVSYKKDAHLREISPANRLIENIDELISRAKNAMKEVSNFYSEVKSLDKNPKLIGEIKNG